MRVTPARAIPIEAAMLDRARIGFERDLAVAGTRMRAATPSIIRAIASGANRLGVPPPKKTLTSSRPASAAPKSSQIAIKIGQQRIDVRIDRQSRPRCACELKSQYGHFFTHHGMWMYSDSGGRSGSAV